VIRDNFTDLDSRATDLGTRVSTIEAAMPSGPTLVTVTFGTVDPSPVPNGTLWFDSTAGELKLMNAGTWVVIGP
jgi:hypothetical protein